jgi:cytochrome c oxidase subunit 2
MSFRKKVVCLFLFVFLLLITGCGSEESTTKEDTSTVETTESIETDQGAVETPVIETTNESSPTTANEKSSGETTLKNTVTKDTASQKVTTNIKPQEPKQQSKPAQKNAGELKEEQVVVIEPVAPAATSATAPTPATATAPAPAPAPAPEPVAPQQAVVNAEPRVIKIEVTNWAWKFEPVPLVVGAPVIFKVNVIEGEHGFQITDTSINEVIQEGQSYEIAWTPEKTGTFTIRCSVLCGSGHSAMRSQLQVKE